MRLYVLPRERHGRSMRSSAASVPIQDMPFGEANPLLRGLGFAARRRKHVLPPSHQQYAMTDTSKSRDVDTEIEVDVLEAGRDPFAGGHDGARV
jgi:hypothetical protein